MYKINDKIFYMKIDEQVEYLTQLINEIDQEYKDTATALDTRITTIESKCKEFDEAFTNVNEKISTLEATEKAHYEEVLASIAEQATTFQGKIDSLKSELEQEIALKQNINDDTLKTESKKIVGAINENKDTIDSNKTELENKIAVKQDMTDNSLKTNTKTIVGAINEVFDKESTGVAIDEKTITLTDNNAIQVNPEMLTQHKLFLKDYIDDSESYIKASIEIAASQSNTPDKEYYDFNKDFRIYNIDSTNIEPDFLGFGTINDDPETFAKVLYASAQELKVDPQTAYLTASQCIEFESKTIYTPFLTFKLIRELFTPIGYVMASTQATVPVYWGTWQQLGYITVNSEKVYYYKRTA